MLSACLLTPRLENLVVREEAVVVRQQRILLTSERVCCHCYKRIGTSAFVAYPNEQLAHYLCFKRAPGSQTLTGPTSHSKTITSSGAGSTSGWAGSGQALAGLGVAGGVSQMVAGEVLHGSGSGSSGVAGEAGHPSSTD